MSYYCFVIDHEGHWYKIPVSKRENFHDFIDSDTDWSGEDYSKYRCMHPINYMFKEIEVLKESKDFFKTLNEFPKISDDPIVKPKIRKIKK